ncbi:MAG: hypothetical protein U9P70_02570 [Patescibacteria group bacterium]|nr:hypothetical protein [Patescibacteria group bacterium]
MSERIYLKPERAYLNNEGIRLVEKIYEIRGVARREVGKGPFRIIQRISSEPGSGDDYEAISVFIPEFGMPILVPEDGIERTEEFERPKKCKVCGAILEDTCVFCPSYMPGCCPGILYHDKCQKCCDYDWQSTIVFRYTKEEIEKYCLFQNRLRR